MNEKYDYGECDICEGPIEERIIDQDFWIKGRLIVVTDVPAGVCTRCGNKTAKADVGLWLVDTLQDKKRITDAPTIEVPKLAYQA